VASPRDAVLVVDNSDHRRAGGWFADCLKGFAAATVVAREDLDADDARWRAVILAGSERSVFENAPWLEKQFSFVRNVMAGGVPLLGVCFGHQLMFRALYGKDVLARRAVPEVGWEPVELKRHELFAGVPSTIRPYNFHFDEVAEVPAGWRLFASSGSCRVHAVSHEELPAWGLQFHPEVTVAEAVAGISRGGQLLAGYGMDAASIAAAAGQGAGYYPEIIRNFVAVYAG
jgi:GMP synthase-like glutamine amidotransferase